MIYSYIIMDGQWGSSGKGLLAGYLARKNNPDVIVCNFGPNAGHTVILPYKGNWGVDSNGASIPDPSKKVMTQQLPSGIVSRSAHSILIGPGAIINPAILLAEISRYERFLGRSDIMIHPRAAVVTEFDLLMEECLTSVSSTRKGVGAATANKVMRRAKGTTHLPVIARDCPELVPFLITENRYHSVINSANVLQVESAQGLELSLNHGSSYPYCTSRDITVEAILNDVGLRHGQLNEVFVALRTYPIRVGHEYDKLGVKIGDSGPVYKDMDELTWGQLSAESGIDLEERTTVTNKVRRVFTWSDYQFENMLSKIGPCSIFINFMNYLDPKANTLVSANPKTRRFVYRARLIADRSESNIKLLGWGPMVDQIEEIKCPIPKW